MSSIRHGFPDFQVPCLDRTAFIFKLRIFVFAGIWGEAPTRAKTLVHKDFLSAECSAKSCNSTCGECVASILT